MDGELKIGDIAPAFTLPTDKLKDNDGRGLNDFSQNPRKRRHPAEEEASPFQNPRK